MHECDRQQTDKICYRERVAIERLACAIAIQPNNHKINNRFRCKVTSLNSDAENTCNRARSKHCDHNKVCHYQQQTISNNFRWHPTCHCQRLSLPAGWVYQRILN